MKTTYLAFCSLVAGGAVSGQSLIFNNFSLETDAAGDVGDVYRYSNVVNGVDARIQVLEIGGNAKLLNIDDAPGAAISAQDSAAFRPIISSVSQNFQEQTHYVRFGVSFVDSITSDRRFLSEVSFQIFDTDGDDDNSNRFIDGEDGDLREFAVVRSSDAQLQSFGSSLSRFSVPGFEGVIATNSETTPGVNDTAEFLSQFGGQEVDSYEFILGAVGTDSVASLDNDRLYGAYFNGNVPTVTPEPSSALLLALAGASSLVRRRRA